MTTGLLARARQATTWAAIGYAASQAIRLGSNIALTRMLAPDAFAIMAVVIMLSTALGLVSDLGIGRTVIQSPRASEHRFLCTAWSIQVVRGALLTLACFAMALLLYCVQYNIDSIKNIYGDSRLPWVIAAFGVTLLISGTDSVALYLAKRDLQRMRLTVIELLGQVSGAVVTLGLAWVTRSFWSLVVGAVVAAIVRSALSHWFLDGPRLSFCFDPASRNELTGQAKWFISSSLLSFAAANVDKVILSSILTPTNFGIYTIALLLAAAIQMAASTLVAEIAYPALCEVSRTRPKDLARVLSRFQQAVDLLACSLAAFLAVAAPTLISIIYDTRYSDSGWILSILALGLIGQRYHVVEQCYIALGSISILALSNLFRVLSLTGFVLIGFSLGGLQGAVAGVAAAPFATWPIAIYFRYVNGLHTWKGERLFVPSLIIGGTLGFAFVKIFS